MGVEGWRRVRRHAGREETQKRYSAKEFMGNAEAQEMRHAAWEVSVTRCSFFVRSKQIFVPLLMILTFLCQCELECIKCAHDWTCEPWTGFYLRSKSQTRLQDCREHQDTVFCTALANMELFWLLARGMSEMNILTRLKGDISLESCCHTTGVRSGSFDR